MKGFIKLHRKMLDWEWYSDANVKSVFLHLLLSANFTSSRWRGVEIETGQLIIGVEKLGSQLGLTRQQTRTALNKLKSTGEITIESTSKYTLVTICNWQEYQNEGEKATNKTPSNQPTGNHQVTIKQPTNNHSVRKKELKNLRTKEKDLTRVRADVPSGTLDSEPEYSQLKTKTAVYDQDENVNELIHSFIACRKKLKKPMTDKAIELFVAKLMRLSGGDTASKISMLEEAIERGWQTIYAPKSEAAVEVFRPPEKREERTDDELKRLLGGG